MGYPPIENHGIIGNLHTVALVGMDGAIDFLCFPRFDSPSVFAALLDQQKGGRFQIMPVMENVRTKQLYLSDTAILFTRFLADQGIAEVSDFMPIYEANERHELIRRAKAVRGDITFRLVCQPAFDYGRAELKLEQKKEEVLMTSKGNDKTALRLRTPVPLRIEKGAVVAEFTLKAGESVAFILEDAGAETESPGADRGYVAEAFKQTMNFWRHWIGQCNYHGRWQDMVNRSAITLKLLTYKPSGSIVAAPTFSLPEEIGGVRNWDYRFTWIRDTSLTLCALMRLGYTREAKAFMEWIEQRCRELPPEGSLQIMYAVDGRKLLDEKELKHWEGYRCSAPVRIGNAAHTHLQLDIYGELMDAVYLYNKHGDPIPYEFWQNLLRLMDWLCNHWQEPDQSIWEVRGGRREFLYSRMMCWVALDRAIRIALKRSFPAPLDYWRGIRDEIYRQVYTDFWNPEMKAFVQFRGSKNVDASCLLMPIMKFISPTDPKWVATMHAIETHLVEDSMVRRYRINDTALEGISGEEGAFAMCAFWYIECLTLSGDLEQARFSFEKTLGYANHLGLFSEELSHRGELLGNFPQAFTHLALIGAAYNLERRLESRQQPTGFSISTTPHV